MSVTTNSIESRFRVFGKACHLVINRGNGVSTETLQLAEQEFRRIESKFDSYLQQSITHQINQRAGTGELTALDAEARSLFQFAGALWKESNHLFDPTTCLLQRLYTQAQHGPVTESDVTTALATVGWSKLEITEQGAHLAEPSMAIDLNSCIRPYAVDCVRKLLVRAGVEHGLIDLDCDIVTIGKQPDGANWLIGVRHPSGPRTAIERFKLNNRGYAIRGNFENSLLIGDEKFSRVLSPVDGHPIPGLLGVAVVADSCLTACSAASVARFKTEQNALSWLEKLGLPWLAISRDHSCHGPLLRGVA